MKMTIFEAYNKAKKKLADAGIRDNVFEAKQIIKHITGLNAAQILSNYTRVLTEFEETNYIAILKQREIRYPLQYIFGKWEFYGRSFYVGPGVLVPRPDTETVVEECIEFLKEKEKPTVLDLCAGSGCIGITLAKEIPDSSVIMAEKYDEALRYALKNIDYNKAENAVALKGDVLAGDFSEGSFDLIVSNPPYIPESERRLMSPETKFEPETALMAEDEGLQFYKAITQNYYNSLKDGGMLCFEIGFSQGEAVSTILNEAGFKDVKIRKDLGGICRAVSGIKTEER